MNRIINIVLLLWAVLASFYSYRLSTQVEKANSIKLINAPELAACPATTSSLASSLGNESANLPTQEQKSLKIPKNEQDKDRNAYRVSARLSAVEKFVQLDDSQREQLKRKFELELSKQQAPSLEEILGKESADFYHSQVQSAYEKSHNEEVDKEVFYLARILNLSSAQETQVRQVISDVKGSVDFLSHTSETSNPIANLQKMLDSVKVQNELLVEKMKNVLTSEQYLSFQEYQNNSSDSDFSLLHTEPVVTSNPE